MLLWGEKDMAAPTESERKIRLLNMVKKMYHEAKKVYTFQVGENVICEQAWLTLIGNRVFTVVIH